MYDIIFISETGVGKSDFLRCLVTVGRLPEACSCVGVLLTRGGNLRGSRARARATKIRAAEISESSFPARPRDEV